MSTLPATPFAEISQRDLRLRSKEIMDAGEAGRSYTVTRDGRAIGELIPLRRKRRFVPRAEFFFGTAIGVDLDRFRADRDETIDAEPDDPFVRRG